MAQDLGQLIGDVSRLVSNLDTKDNKYYETFYDPTPADVTITTYDNAGNPQTVTIPNHAKLQENFTTWQGTVQPSIDAANANANAAVTTANSAETTANAANTTANNALNAVNEFSVSVTDHAGRAAAQTVKMASGFISPDKGVGYVKTATSGWYSTGYSRVNSYTTVLYANNNIASLMGVGGRTYSNDVFVAGYNIKLRQGLTTFGDLWFYLNAAPTTGSRQDYVFIEAWKEEFILGSDDVVFPFGCVHFKENGTLDGCVLSNTGHTGGNYPAYLDSASNHGYYVPTNAANIKEFLSNPDHNVSRGADGKWYQIRWRLRIVDGVNPLMRRSSMDTTNVKAQGQLASPSTFSFAWDKGIVCDLANDSTLASDGDVFSIPVALIHRRNSTAFSLDNVNGAGSRASGISGRPDGKFYDIIDPEDVLDLRNRVAESFDYQALFDETYQNIYNDHATETMFENFLSDANGDGTYVDHNIWSKKPLQFEGISNSGFGTKQVVKKTNTNNGVSASFDGLRSYYSDAPGTQTIVGRVNDITVDGVEPTSLFTYTASNKTLVVDATDLESNDGLNTYRTKVSNRTPELMWDHDPLAGTPSSNKVAITWTGLGTDSAVGVIDKGTHIIKVQGSGSTGILKGDIYQSPNGVNCTMDINLDGIATDHFSCYFEGNVVPDSGSWTRQTGSGSPTITVNDDTLNLLGNMYIAGDDGYSYSYIDNGVGSDLHGSDGFFINAFVDFREGSSVITYAPDGIGNFLGSQWYHNGTQMLPDDGKGWIPFGIENDADLRPSYNKSVGLKGFMKKTNHTGLHGCSVVKWNGTYYLVDDISESGGYLTRLRTSTDMFTWSAPVVIASHTNAAFDQTQTTTYCMPNAILVDDNKLKVMLQAHRSTTHKVSLFMIESTDGITWSDPVLIFDSSQGSFSGSISKSALIKDGATWELFYNHGGSDGDGYYATSTDLVTWTDHGKVSDTAVRRVIKENGIYKNFMIDYQSGSSNGIAVRTSKDGINWSGRAVLNYGDISMSEYNNSLSYQYSFIKEDNKYVGFGTLSGGGLNIVILTMTDDANTGSSTTGVYPTEGTLNCAPAPTDEVVFMYKHMAISPGDLDAMYSGILKFENTHVHNAVITASNFADTRAEGTHLNCVLINQMSQMLNLSVASGFHVGYGSSAFALDRGIDSASNQPRYSFSKVKTSNYYSTSMNNTYSSAKYWSYDNHKYSGKQSTSLYLSPHQILAEGLTIYGYILALSNRLVVVDNQLCFRIKSSNVLTNDTNYIAYYSINPMCVGRPLVKQS